MCEFCSLKVMGEDGAVVVASGTHDGGSNLAESYAMAPTGSGQGKAGRYMGYAGGVRLYLQHSFLIDHKGRTV